MQTASTASVADVEAAARQELRWSPKVWAFEVPRFVAYLFGRVTFVPWCLVWPALTVWLIWWTEDVGARGAIEIFANGPDRVYAWIYVIGALFHSLAIVGSDPYERELERRVRAKVLTHSARGRWLKKEPAKAVAATQCPAPKGWERVDAGLEAS